MNYRHGYHAGNFADVFKHITLVTLIKAMAKKDTPFCYLDTHAGSGRYDLTSLPAQKNKEYESGISKIIKASNPPAVVTEYLQCIKKLNSTPEITVYPGSPYFAQYFLRQQDRLLLCELHDEEFQELRKFFRPDKRIAVHHENGYLGLKAFLPPKEKRGLILIDPPYEKPDELEQLSDLLPKALHRFETGVYALWFPIKDPRAANHFVEILQKKISRPLFVSKLMAFSHPLPNQLNGSGMLVINPPWKLEEEIAGFLPWLEELLLQR